MPRFPQVNEQELIIRAYDAEANCKHELIRGLKAAFKKEGKESSDEKLSHKPKNVDAPLSISLLHEYCHNLFVIHGG